MPITSYVQGFHWFSQSFYAKVLTSDKFVDEVILGVYDSEDGGALGELVVRWETLNSPPRLQAWQHSWGMFPYFVDILASLSAEGSTTPQDFVARLLKEGLLDLTDRDHSRQLDSDIEYKSWIERLASDQDKRTIA